MDNKNNRSVFERLGDIEEAIKDNKSEINLNIGGLSSVDCKGKTSFSETAESMSISDMIGEPFGEYMKSSTIYYYEPDERKFQNYKKKQLKRSIIILAIYLIIPLVHIFISIFDNVFIPLIYIADLLLVIMPIFCLIYVLKQKSKELADQKWNLKNHRFYVYDNNKLGEENTKGLLSKIFLVCKIVTFALFAVSWLPYYFDKSYANGSSTILFSTFIMACYIFSIHFILVTPRDYFYFSYIFEKEESYVIRNMNLWEKHIK